jgi:hypothetical protein
MNLRTIMDNLNLQFEYFVAINKSKQSKTKKRGNIFLWMTDAMKIGVMAIFLCNCDGETHSAPLAIN